MTKKVKKPVARNEYVKASNEKLKKGINQGSNDAIAEVLRRMGI
jgi:hypothetical protein